MLPTSLSDALSLPELVTCRALSEVMTPAPR